MIAIVMDELSEFTPEMTQAAFEKSRQIGRNIVWFPPWVSPEEANAILEQASLDAEVQ